MTGFNDGIEAAAQCVEEILKRSDAMYDFTQAKSKTLKSIRALKRPEPSDPAFKGLKPCPFCGESMCFTWVGNAADSAEAMEAPMCACGAQGPMYPTRTDAIAAWNKRPEPSEAEKVERVAMWLFMEDQSGMMYPRKWDRLADSAREWWRIKARAAIKAMEQQ